MDGLGKCSGARRRADRAPAARLSVEPAPWVSTPNSVPKDEMDSSPAAHAGLSNCSNTLQPSSPTSDFLTSAESYEHTLPSAVAEEMCASATSLQHETACSHDKNSRRYLCLSDLRRLPNGQGDQCLAMASGLYVEIYATLGGKAVQKYVLTNHGNEMRWTSQVSMSSSVAYSSFV